MIPKNLTQDEVSLATILSRLQKLLGGVGGLGVLGGGLWYLVYWGHRDEWYCMFWTGGACATFEAAARAQGFVPYSPLPLWIGLGLCLLGAGLRYVLRPMRPERKGVL